MEMFLHRVQHYSESKAALYSKNQQGRGLLKLQEFFISVYAAMPRVPKQDNMYKPLKNERLNNSCSCCCETRSVYPECCKAVLSLSVAASSPSSNLRVQTWSEIHW